MNLAERLYLRLLEALRQGGVRHDQEITVGDVYQHLVPYRAVRSELGVFELAEYEHALLQLLAGEGEFLRVADETVRSELAAELRSPNPILGIYRDYAASPVVLLRSGEELRASAAADADSPGTAPKGTEEETVRPVTDFLQEDSDDAADEVSARESAGDVGGRNAPRVGNAAGGPARSRQDPSDQASVGEPRPLPPLDYPAPSPAPADATRVAGHSPAPFPDRDSGDAQRPQVMQAECVRCGQILPEVEGLRFCPYCGIDQTVLPCERCGTPLQPEWSFCIRCGTRRSLPPAAGA